MVGIRLEREGIKLAVPRSEERFEYELEVFRREADEAVQHLYAYLTMHAVAAEDKAVRQLFNSFPLFWLTTLRGLQTSLFMVLGRIFSQDSEHNLDALLRLAETDREIFSRESLATRKSSIAGLDVQAYVSDAHIPTREDFRGFRREVKEWRRIYEANYREVRNQIFAHAEVSQPEDVHDLFAKTNIQELELLVTDLVGLHTRLQGWLQNGTPPVAVRANSSVQELRKLPPSTLRYTLQGRVIHDTERSLQVAVAGLPQQGRPSRP
jgi:HEPN superfamily AbiU2-like protein